MQQSGSVPIFANRATASGAARVATGRSLALPHTVRLEPGHTPPSAQAIFVNSNLGELYAIAADADGTLIRLHDDDVLLVDSARGVPVIVPAPATSPEALAARGLSAEPPHARQIVGVLYRE